MKNELREQQVLKSAASLVLAWTAIFIWQAHLLTLSSLAFSGAALGRGEWWRVLTAPLAHGSLGHLVLNSTTLLLLAPLAGRHFGAERSFALLTLGALSGEVAVAFHAPTQRGLGASAGICALMTALAVKDRPHRWFFSAAAVAAVLVSFHAAGAPIAHLAGAAAGLLLGRFPPPRWLGFALLAASLVALFESAYHLNPPDSVAAGMKKSWPLGPIRREREG